MGCPFVHIEIPVSDYLKAQEFYGKLFGWEFEYIPEPSYMLFNPGREPGGGFWIPREGQPRQVLNYIGVENIDEMAAKIEGEGGKILVPKTPVGNMGFFVVFSDPDGNVLALWESAPSADID